MKADWPDLAARVLGCAPEVVTGRGGTESFIALGGTSLQAAELVAIAERELGQSADLAGLLGAQPLAGVVAQAVAYTPVEPPRAGAGLRPLLPEQDSLLGMDVQFGGAANHLLFTAEADGELDKAALVSTLESLTRRHEALRTVFVRHKHSMRRRVLPHWHPRLLIERLTPAAGDDPVAVVQTRLETAGSALLDPFDKPPVVFVWTQVAGRGHLLSLLFHHTALDGWSAGMFWREFAATYAAEGRGPHGPGASPEVAVVRRKRLSASGRIAELTKTRVAELVGVSDLLELPTDLTRPASWDTRGVRCRFGLGERARDAAQEVARQAGVTRTAVLLTAWGLVLARRAGVKDFLIGMATAGRPTADLQDLVAMCTRVVPVRLTLAGAASVAECSRLTAAHMAQAVAAQDVPFGQLVVELGKARDFESLPFPNYCFAAHDDMVPEALDAGPVTFTLHEGHCGSAVFEATLFVQRWGSSPRLALEYKPSAITAAQAAGLAEAFEQTLIDMAEAESIVDVRGMSAPQRWMLNQLRDGPAGSTADGPWEIIAAQDKSTPAVRAADAELSYGELVEAVCGYAGRLAEVGVGAGDRVIVAIPRSAAEVVAVLAIIRQGATYVAVDPAAPERHLRDILDQTTPHAVIGPEEVAALAAGCPAVPPWTPHAGPAAAVASAAPPGPERVAYVAFTSGSTGRPKGVMVPNRGIVRLVHDVDYMRVNPEEGFLRLAPLTFDASTLEIFAPLLNGGTIEVFPDGPVSPSPLADFLVARGVHNVFLTAGLFRLQVDHRPDGFAAARHVMTGGDVVPSAQVKVLLERFPGLRVSNLYGPTENSVVTTAFGVNDPCQVTEPLPIGGAIPATSVLVLDEDLRLVPPGGVGELYTGGLGLATGYLGMVEETTAQFGFTAPGTGERLYRTGDLVRWDDAGRLRFLGRKDNQIKVSGYRIELDAVAARLRAHPSVRDAVVAGTAGDAGSRRLIAAVVADNAPGLVGELRKWVAESLPDYAVPALWAVVGALPVTANGKVATKALEAAATEQALADLEPVTS